MEIAPGIHSLSELKGIYVHAFLLDDGDGLTLIDTLHSADGHVIFDQIRSLGRPITDLKRIVLTHAHRAHMGGLAALQTASGASIYSHEWEADIIAGDRKQQCMSFLPKKPYVLWPAQLASLFGRHNPCQVDGFLVEGDSSGPLQVVSTPGHSPGHLAFYWPERRALFAGDSLVTWPELGPGWPGFMLNHRQNRHSMDKIAALDIEVLGVGHGDPIATGGGVRLREFLSTFRG